MSKILEQTPNTANADHEEALEARAFTQARNCWEKFEHWFWYHNHTMFEHQAN